MQLRLADFAVNEKKSIEIRGDEPWLESVYQEFFARNGGELQPGEGIFGIFKVQKTSENSLSMQATVRFEATVECTGCQGPVFWAIDESFERSFRLSKEFVAVLELTSADLDEDLLYEDKIDLAAIISETLVLAMSTQTSESCASCQNDEGDRTSRLVYAGQAKGESKSQPFQVLKDLL